jgi:D-alanyl-lipoteichoic acid acyltransferase DltB (MBOAT superfamily)
MLFTSFNFWLVFPAIFLLYWLIPASYNKVRNIFLLIVSYLLYLNWNPAFGLVLFGVTTICYWGGYFIEFEQAKRRLVVCVTFTCLGLLPLIVFKYYNFIVSNVSSLFKLSGLHFSFTGLNWAIPIGISFYSFQAVGYLLDVYKRRVSSEKSFVDFALFVSFFPQVTSGPISTAKELMPQIKTAKTFKYEQGRDGLKLLLWGMFLKLALADRIGGYVDTVYTYYTHYSGAVCYMASIMYTLQIYCDFAGYSFMAIGIAKTLGYDLINNFERPYFAASVTEFWRRWHISLTRWLTTHVYISMGGNRCHKLRQYFNILVIFLVSGLWHGASWTFIVWGALHGLFQIVEKFFFGNIIKAELKQNCIQLSLMRIFRILITFNLVNLAWIFFRMPTIGDSVRFITRIITDFGSFSLEPMIPLYAICIALCLPILLIKDFRDEYYPGTINNKALKWMFYIIVASFLICFGCLDSGQFIYVNF